jgi:RNA polymerase sigma-70 factor, ECF subfamily
VTGSGVPGHVAAGEAELVARLRDGDERAFEECVESFYPTMIAIARGFVRTRAVAEEVVQEAWLGVLRGLDRFEGRSSLRGWVMTIVANTARTRATREGRSVPFSSFEREGSERVVEPERFRGPDDPFPGHWKSSPTDWRTLPEPQLLARETLELVQRAIDELPELQRFVITLRDVSGWSPKEVSEALEISAGNQRVLLHRARARVRARLERHLDG